MSRETLETLNTKTLIGYTEKRGKAWHWRADLQGAEPNHYEGPVPVEDVRRRLIDSWHPIETRLTHTALTEDGVISLESPSVKGYVRSDDHTEVSVVGIDRALHAYEEWLLENLEVITLTELKIASAIQVKNGAVMSVSLEMEDTFEVGSTGVQFRPWLAAITSLDASYATTYKQGNTNIVCDNTQHAFFAQRTPEVFKVRHTKNSHLRIEDARKALHLVELTAGQFDQQVRRLTSEPVSDAQFREFSKAWSAPTMPNPSDRSKTIASNKQTELLKLWKFDDRVAPWSGTAWGVVQAVNTYDQHIGTAKGGSRLERNTIKALSGGFEKLDAATYSLLQKTLVHA